MDYDQLQEIENSVINGNRDQAYNQIMEYGYHNFFKEYRSFLEDFGYSATTILKRYTDMVDLFIARIEL